LLVSSTRPYTDPAGIDGADDRSPSAQAAVALRCARARRVEGHIGTHAGEAANTEALDTRRDQQRHRKPVAADITLSFA
jgi:hypothetical protein